MFSRRREEGMDEELRTNQETTAVTLGVDTHLDRHMAVALDGLGRRLGELSVPTKTGGYGRLLAWAEGFGTPVRVGIEGACSYGAGLSRYLKARGIEVLEAERPKRRHRYGTGKSDPIDAEIAARAVLAGQANGVPKSGEGHVEMIRTLRSARRSAVKAKDQAGNQLKRHSWSPHRRACEYVSAGSRPSRWSPPRHALGPVSGRPTSRPLLGSR